MAIFFTKLKSTSASAVVHFTLSLLQRDILGAVLLPPLLPPLVPPRLGIQGWKAMWKRHRFRLGIRKEIRSRGEKSGLSLRTHPTNTRMYWQLCVSKFYDFALDRALHDHSQDIIASHKSNDTHTCPLRKGLRYVQREAVPALAGASVRRNGPKACARGAVE